MASRCLSLRTAILALGAIAVAVLLWAVSVASNGTPAASAATAKPANLFDGSSAFSLLREQVRDYGWRPAGSDALRRLAERLRTLLPNGTFEDVPNHPGLRNVVGTVPGKLPAILVAAHYDVEASPKGFVGANDGAAGTAAVVTLARAFSTATPPANARALRFVLFDGEEEPAGCKPFLACGVRGSTAYAAAHSSEIHAMVLLDYIAEKKGQTFPREGGSDPALWAKLRTAAKAAGVESVFPDKDRGTKIQDDHTPFTQRGVKAIDVIDFDYPQRDSLKDNLDAVSESSLDKVGEAAHRLVATLRAGG